MAKTYDLGAVTAYAIAVEHGYTGTEQEWIDELMATTANAQLAKDSADFVQTRTFGAVIQDHVVQIDEKEVVTDSLTQRAEAANTSAQQAKTDAEAYAVGKRNGVDVSSSDVTYHNNAKYYAETLTTDNTLSITGRAADAKKVGDELTSLKGDLDEIEDNLKYYEEELISESATADGWRLDGSGKCVEASSYRMVKYAVTAGDKLHLVLSKDVTSSEAEGVYQWQSAASVPSSLPNNNLVGSPVSEAVDKYVTVPENATYLIVSQFKTNDSNYVYLATDSISIQEKIHEVDEKIDSINPGLSSDAINALLQCFENVKWSDEHGQNYYDTLYDALYGITPDPDVPRIYAKYDWIRLKHYSEVPSGTYYDGGSTSQNVGLYKNGILATASYADLNQLNFKATIGIIPSSTLANDRNSCAFGGGVSGGATSRIGNYWNISKQWVYVMMHGQELKFTQELNDVNTFEIINSNSSPSQVKINGVSQSFPWVNSNVINAPISYFVAYDFNEAPNTGNAGTYTKVGDIEVSNQGGTVISKLIPVVRKADNVIGIWDSIRKEFYTTSTLSYVTIGNASCIYDVGKWNSQEVI